MWGEGGLECGRESCDNGGVNVDSNSDLAMTCVESFRFFLEGGGGGYFSPHYLPLSLLGHSSLLARTSIPNMVVQCIHPRVYGCLATFKGNWGDLIKT